MHAVDLIRKKRDGQRPSRSVGSPPAKPNRFHIGGSLKVAVAGGMEPQR